MRTPFLILVILFTIGIHPGFHWAHASENAVLVVNAQSAASKLVANYYVQARNIPVENVIYLDNIPRREFMDVEDFRKLILNPIFITIESRKLRQIDYVVYSSDFPTIIKAGSDKAVLMDKLDFQPGSIDSKVLTAQISINSATFFALNILARDPSYLSLHANTYYRGEANRLLTKPFIGDDQKLFLEATKDSRERRFDEAIEKLTELADKHPKQIAVAYWMARIYAWKGEVQDCKRWLSKSIELGWCYRGYTQQDATFQSILDDPEIQSVLNLIPDLPFRSAPTQSFHSSDFWGPNNSANATVGQGNRYLLSAVLAVNRSKGTSEKETLDYLKRSVAADGTNPSGTFYFTRTGNVRTKTRLPGIRQAVEELNLLGHTAAVLDEKLPTHRDDVMGLTMGDSLFNWQKAGNKIIPGAICENLTSFGGRLIPEVGQTKLSTFLRSGAAGSSGTVVEPYSIQQKFPHPRIHVHYARGCNLAESFYQSVSGPFQLLVVGDPFCQPWAKFCQLELQGDLQNDSDLSGLLRFSVKDVSSDPAVDRIEILIDGRRIRTVKGPETGPVTIDSRTLPDGYHEMRFVGITAGPVSSRSSLIVPMTINNRNQQVKCEVESVDWDVDQIVEVKASAPGADQIQIVHNERQLAESSGENGEFQIPAFEFGRGEIRLETRARFGKTIVRSTPIPLRINGPISTTIPQLKSGSDIPKRRKKRNEK